VKLNKNQQQKIILGVMLLGGVIYTANQFLLSPLAVERAKLSEEITANEPKLREMRGQIARTKGFEEKAPQSANLMAQVDSMIPNGAPIAWFPPKVSDFFKANGVDKAVAKFGTESVEKELNGYRRLTWSIDIPDADFLRFAHALSKLENAEPLFEFAGFEIKANREQPDSQRILLSVQNIIKKQ
jgi:hypothetical protein